MAKRKYVSKHKRKISRAHKLSALSYLPVLFLLTFILSSVWTFRHHSSSIFITHAEPIKQREVAVITPEVTTPTPTDTEKVLTAKSAEAGYCLTVPILFYHHIEPLQEADKQGHAQLTVDSAFFDSQMAYLVQSGYTSLSAEELVSALKSHTSLPQKSVVITFDDGYDDAYNYAFPILKNHHLKGNFMIPTGLVGGSDYMTWDQLKEINNDSNMRIYNHSVSHASLGSEGRDRVVYEIAYANQQLSDHLGIKPNIFTYPYGSFSDVVMQVLSDTGFAGAFTTLPGEVQCDTMLTQLHRTRIGNSPLSFYGL